MRAAASRIITTRRHAAGRQHLAAALNWWIGRASFSLRQLALISDWATGEEGLLIHSQISHLRNGNIRTPGMINLDALYQINVALWRWHVHGAAACLNHYGPHRPLGIEDAWLDDSIWLHHPDQADSPLDFGDWCEIVAGYLTLPYIGSINLSPNEARDLSQRLAELLEGIASGMGIGLRRGLDAVLAAYPPEEPKRRDKLRAVIMGQADYGLDELKDELWDLAVTVATLRGIPPESFGPTALHVELTSSRRRS